MSRPLTFRQVAALGVAALALEGMLSAATPNTPGHERLIHRLAPSGLPSTAHLLALIAGLWLLVLVPKLWRGTKTAVPLAISGLLALSLLNVVKGLDFDEAALDLGVASLLALGHRAFPLGCRGRPDLAAVLAALAAWALTYCAMLVGPLTSDHGRTLGRALHDSIGRPHLNPSWTLLIDGLIASAVLISLLAVRSVLRPVSAANGHTEEDYRAAREIVERYGEDSLSPFVLRPDKEFHITADGMLAYRVIGETAVVSGDPVAPPGRAAQVIASFRLFARQQGWQVVFWGASERHLDVYGACGMRAVCTGEEAFVKPESFSLEGRRVRKLRQSLHRLERRGWEISACAGAELETAATQEMQALEARWRSEQRRILGFAMGMGGWDPDRGDQDLYLLARSPEGELRAVMRFVGHRGKLSLDTMRRVGETPNGLNEALICRALLVARERGVPEVSLNYAGLGHLVRGEAHGGRLARRITQTALGALGSRFQMSRLVRFDNKFQPEWRPRFLIFDSWTELPQLVLRVLQAEGYLPQRSAARRWLRPRLRVGRAVPAEAHADARH